MAAEGTSQVAFLHSGKLRVHYLEQTGQEKTCYFFTDGNFISSYTSFLTQIPSVESISAIEPCELWVIQKNDLETLSSAISFLHIWRGVVAEDLFIAMEKRIYKLQSKTASGRYELLIKEISRHCTYSINSVASFLGITTEYLSRLRKEASK